MKRHFLIAVIVLSLCTGLVLWHTGRVVEAKALAAAQTASSFKASTAQIDITPSNNDFPRMFLAGFSGRGIDTPAAGTIQGEPLLSARALAFADGGCSPKVIVTADILGFTRQMRQHILSAVQQRYGLSAENLLLSASHTHNGPVLTDNLDPRVSYPGFSSDGIAGSADLVIVDNYTNWLQTAIVNLIGTAISGLSTAPQVTLSYGVGAADFAHNRVGLTDLDNVVPVLALKSVNDNRLVAVVFGYACHPIKTGGTAAYYWHPDYPGVARQILEQTNGGMAFFIQGAAGDINPNGDTRLEEPFVEQQGAMLATGVQTVLTGGAMQQISGPILTAVQELALPLNMDPSDPTHQQLRAKYVNILDIASNRNPQLRADPYYIRHANQMIAQIDNNTLPVNENWPVAVWHFGTNDSLVLAALGGEVVTHYSLALKSQFSSQLGNKLWVAAYSNEVPGYIPSNEVWDLTGYEAGWVVGQDGGPFVSSFETSQMFYGWPAPLKRGDGVTPGVQEIVLANITNMISNLPTNTGDTTPPVITLNGANPMTVQCSTGFTDPGATALDGCSGTRTVTASGNVNTGVPGSYTITYTASDASGNTATKTRTVNVVDTTAPIIQCPANLVVSLPANSPATSMNVTYSMPTATDTCGSATVSVSKASGSAFPLGTTTVTATANDGRGNTSTCSFTVTVGYSFSGFFQPVDNAPIVNTVTAGSSIPVKFSLSGNKGLNIFAAGYPQSAQVACSGGTPDDIEETVTAGASSLSYDATLDQYKYVWKTDKAWKGTCRKLTLKFIDGSTREALFQFK